MWVCHMYIVHDRKKNLFFYFFLFFSILSPHCQISADELRESEFWPLTRLMPKQLTTHL